MISPVSPPRRDVAVYVGMLRVLSFKNAPNPLEAESGEAITDRLTRQI